MNGGEGQLRFEIINGNATFACAIPAGEAGVTPEPGYIEARNTDGSRRTRLGDLGSLILEHKRSYEIEFSIAERQLILRVDDETVAELPLTPEWTKRTVPSKR